MPRKTKSVELCPPFRESGEAGSSPHETAVGISNSRDERVCPPHAATGVRAKSSLEFCPETLRGLRCCSLNGGAEESDEEGRSPFLQGPSGGELHDCDAAKHEGQMTRDTQRRALRTYGLFEGSRGKSSSPGDRQREEVAGPKQHRIRPERPASGNGARERVLAKLSRAGVIRAARFPLAR